jgi:hypothetical protein
VLGSSQPPRGPDGPTYSGSTHRHMTRIGRLATAAHFRPERHSWRRRTLRQGEEELTGRGDVPPECLPSGASRRPNVRRSASWLLLPRCWRETQLFRIHPPHQGTAEGTCERVQFGPIDGAEARRLALHCRPTERPGSAPQPPLMGWAVSPLVARPSACAVGGATGRSRRCSGPGRLVRGRDR